LCTCIKHNVGPGDLCLIRDLVLRRCPLTSEDENCRSYRQVV
jgi:hypothetical protein